MGAAEFSNIGKRVGDNKSTALIPGMFDGYALLCYLIWTKSSLDISAVRLREIFRLRNAASCAASFGCVDSKNSPASRD